MQIRPQAGEEENTGFQFLLFITQHATCMHSSEGVNICEHVKDPKHWQPYLCLDTRKYRTHR